MTENDSSFCPTEMSETTISTSVWKLRRYGRLLPTNKKECANTSWKVYDSNESEGQIELSILESSHFLVSQSEELLDFLWSSFLLYDNVAQFSDRGREVTLMEGFSLINATSFLKVQKKADVLLFQATLKLGLGFQQGSKSAPATSQMLENFKGESRIFRVQFGGANRAEAVEECERAVMRLQDFLPVGCQEKPMATPSGSGTQLPLQPEQAHRAEASEKVQGSLSLKRLSQHFLGEGSLSLPLLYQASGPLAPADLELLRLCLLDPAFPAYVEEVEGELRRLCQE